MPGHDDEWTLLRGVQMLPERIRPLTSRAAKELFLMRFAEIKTSALTSTNQD